MPVLLSYINAALCATNVAMYVGVDAHYWWNAAVAVFCGLVALIIGMERR